MRECNPNCKEKNYCDRYQNEPSCYKCKFMKPEHGHKCVECRGISLKKDAACLFKNRFNK